MKTKILNWVKGQLGLIVDDTDLTSYLLLKVDYQSQCIQELQDSIEILQGNIESTEMDVSELRDECSRLDDDFNEYSFGQMYNELEDLKDEMRELEIPTESDIRDIIQYEIENMPKEISAEEELDNIMSSEDQLSLERLVRDISRDEILGYNAFIIESLEKRDV
mgnify:CR=1 FL=1